MPDYKNGKIYAIRSHQTDLVYIGSTTQPLHKRLWGHKNEQKNVSSKQLLCYEDAYIELIEDFPCENKEQLNKREGEIIRNTNCVNKNVAGRTQKDYYEDNKDTLLEKAKEYKKQNKEVLRERYKEYYEANKEKLRENKKNKKELLPPGGLPAVFNCSE
jgi:hypothetical protein